MSDPVYIGYYTLTDAASMPSNARFIMYDPAGPGSYNITGALLKAQILASPVVTGQITIPAGTAALPALTTAGDLNTGVHFPAADTVAIATGGVQRVGIADYGLTYIATGSNNALLRASASGTGCAGLYLDASNGDFVGSDYFWLRQNDDLTTEITQAGSYDLLFKTANTERARITSSGKVLIGRTSNSSGLTGYHEIAGNSVFSNTTATTNAFAARVWTKNICTGDMTDGFGTGYVFSIEDNAGVHNNLAHIMAVRAGADNSGAMLFTTYNNGSGGEKARITPTGNLLVGTTTDDAANKLQIWSSGKTGAVFVDQNAYATGCGGGIKFAGKYDTTNAATFAGIQGEKENSTSGNYSGALVFLSRLQGEGAVEGMRLTSNKQLLIGTSTALQTGAVTSLQQISTNSGAASLSILRTGITTAGQPSRLLMGTSRGSVAQVSDGLGSIEFFGNDGTDLTTTGAYIECIVGGTVSNNVLPTYIRVATTNTSGATNTVACFSQTGNVLAGTVTDPGYGAKIHSTAGISLGNTAVANGNVLDWYEEGTFTPVVVGATTAGAGTYTVQVGRFTRIGRNVTIQIQLTWSAHTGTGIMTVAGLPFTNITSTAATALAVSYDGLTVGAGKQLTAYVGSGATAVQLSACDPAGGAVTPLNVDSAVNLLLLSGTYFVP